MSGYQYGQQRQKERAATAANILDPRQLRAWMAAELARIEQQKQAELEEERDRIRGELRLAETERRRAEQLANRAARKLRVVEKPDPFADAETVRQWCLKNQPKPKYGGPEGLRMATREADNWRKPGRKIA